MPFRASSLATGRWLTPSPMSAISFPCSTVKTVPAVSFCMVSLLGIYYAGPRDRPPGKRRSLLPPPACGGGRYGGAQPRRPGGRSSRALGKFLPLLYPTFSGSAIGFGRKHRPGWPHFPRQVLRGAGPHGRPPLGSPRADPPFYCGQPSAAAGRPASSTASTSRMPSSGDCPFCSFTVR